MCIIGKGDFLLKKILYLGWLGYNNLGDELMFDLFQENCSKIFSKNEYQIETSLTKNKIKDFDVIVSGGGSLLGYTPQIEVLYNAVKKNKKIVIWGTGLDSIDKNSMEFLNLKNNDGFISPLATQDEQKLAKIIEQALYVGVRGPLTYQALKQMGMNMNKIQISGDPGFLIKPCNLVPPVNISQWNNELKIIGVNWGTSYNNIYGQDEELVEECLALALKNLINKGYKIYIYTVWPEDHDASTRLYERVADKENVILSTTLYNQQELFSLMKNFIFTINFKLHANVISAMANVPFIALGYRYKVFDFAKSMELDNLVISTDSDNIESQIMMLEKHVTSKRNHISKKINKATKIYESRLLSPFHHSLYI